jgi:LmbE family N-acetylglucosaminyl deacetylase
MVDFRSKLIVAFVAGLLAWPPARAQDRGAPQLDQLVRGLATTARVLVIAAHPDDEDTQTIAYLARAKRVETAYLSLTRGDGGQNLIGNELGEGLGAIRTEELLAARRIDGGRQYFTRAFDFGFSKSAEETAKHWPRDSILGDVVTVIRAFRPHVIYSIWSGTRADGHGHHEMAGIVAREAFDAAMDTVRFPVRRFGEPWTPLKFYRRGPGVTLDINEYNPILGRTYADIAAESRSQHRSQGFAGVALRSVVPGAGGRGGRGGPFGGGSLIRAATRVNESIDPAAEKSIFDGIDTTFKRLIVSAPDRVQDNLESVSIKADSARDALDFRQPWRVAPILARMTAAIQQVRGQMMRCVVRARTGGLVQRAQVGVPSRCTPGELDLDASLETLERRAGQALLAAAELGVEAIASREMLAFGDSMPVTIAIVNRGRAAITVADVRVTGGARKGFDPVTIRPDSGIQVVQSVIGFPDARPWWIGGRDEAMFAGKQSPLDGIARVSSTSEDLVPSVAVSEEMRRLSEVRLTLELGGVSAVVSAGPLVYRNADPLLGVQDRPLGGVPSVTLEFDRNLEWVPAGKPIDRMMRVTVKSFADGPRTFALRVVAPDGIKVDSVPPSVTIASREQQEIFIRLRGTLKPGRYEFGIVGNDPAMGNFAEGFSSTIYPHIRPIYRYRTSGLYLNAVDIEVPARLTVAYVQGVGDDNAVYLRQLGVPIAVVSPAELPQLDLTRFTTVVIGTRAFEANRSLLASVPRLMEFAKNGGTLVVQYGQNPATTPQVFPFPLTWSQPAERVTVEDVPVTVLDARSKLLNFPNRIGGDDWKGWVQERALYMPSTIDPRYQAPLEMHDPDEKPNRGAVLMTPMGKGMYVFTSLSLFRQLPGAVPGGARLFVNLLSAGVPESARRTVP